MKEESKAKNGGVCVYCASSSKCDPFYHQVAFDLGAHLAEHDYTVVYGGGAVGSMGSLAEGALSRDGTVIGILPEFMAELEWGHPRITELALVDNLRTRKHEMLARSSAAVALPGGSGTFEELLETVTLKRLGLYLDPIILVNTRNYFDPLLQLLEQAVSERFMDERHLELWQVVDQPEEVVGAIESAPEWPADSRFFAAL